MDKKDVLKMLFTIEGIDGVGKTTVINTLKGMLVDYKDVIFTKEPQYFTTEQKHALVKMEDPVEKLATFFLDHTKHTREVLNPNIEDKIIICDRYIHSRIAYQALEISRLYEMPLDDVIDYIEGMHYFSYWPDKVYVIWSDEELLAKRLRARHDDMDISDMNRLLATEEVLCHVLTRGDPYSVPYVGVEMDEDGFNYSAMKIYQNIVETIDNS